MEDTVLYPDVTIQLVGQDGNAFSVMGRVTKALRRAGASSDEVQKYMDEAMEGDYDHLLQTTMKWVNCS